MLSTEVIEGLRKKFNKKYCKREMRCTVDGLPGEKDCVLDWEAYDVSDCECLVRKKTDCPYWKRVTVKYSTGANDVWNFLKENVR